MQVLVSFHQALDSRGEVAFLTRVCICSLTTGGNYSPLFPPSLSESKVGRKGGNRLPLASS
jgi:hypothetical protein